MFEKSELERFYSMLESLRPLFIALGDEARQKIIIDIADAGEDGINVTNLSSKYHLSRPAISHHLKVLKDCDLIKPIKVGTQIFYELDIDKNLITMTEFIKSIQKVVTKINKQRMAEE